MQSSCRECLSRALEQGLRATVSDYKLWCVTDCGHPACRISEHYATMRAVIERLFSQEFSMSLLDPKWKYTHSTATDIRQTFVKARRELKKEERPTGQPASNQSIVYETARLFAAGRYARARGGVR